MGWENKGRWRAVRGQPQMLQETPGRGGSGRSFPTAQPRVYLASRLISWLSYLWLLFLLIKEKKMTCLLKKAMAWRSVPSEANDTRAPWPLLLGHTSGSHSLFTVQRCLLKPPSHTWNFRPPQTRSRPCRDILSLVRAICLVFPPPCKIQEAESLNLSKMQFPFL